MPALIATIAPVFVLILMGAGAVRLRLMDVGGIRGLNGFAFWAALPALLFSSIVTAPEVRLVDVAAVYLAACLVLYGLAMLVARRWLGADPAGAAMAGLNASYGNTVMLGIPIVGAAFGPHGVATLLAIIALHSALLLPLATVLLEAGRGSGTRPAAILRRIGPDLLRNPIVMSLVLAFVWRAAALPLPDVLDNLLRLLAGAGPPLALFCLGASLPGPRAGAALREAVVMTALKLLVLPLLVAGLGRLAGLDGLVFKVAVIAAGMPTGANAFLLARRADTSAEASASTVVLSTALAVVTLSAMLAWLP